MPAVEQLRSKFIEKIKELFQVDRSDLDFGIYRILRQKHADILKYLEKRLPEKVKEELSARDQAGIKSIQAELAKAEESARGLGVEPALVPKVKELRARYAASGANVNDDESELYSHLHTFFSRYYDKGDFLSRPRYKGNTYSIPYDGEEVKLHWANADQYYIKSSEYFKDYRFTLANGKTVLFKLVEAGTAVNNTKDKDRRFKLAVDHVIKSIDDDGEEIEETFPTVAIENGELVAHFIYVQTEEKQAELCASANKTIQKFIANSADAAPFRELANLKPTEKQKERTLLEQKLTDYTERNSSDYFIHKNLGGFLRRELDFYIKSEVMNLDDMQDVQNFQPVEKRLRLIQAIRAIAHDLIAFLSQLEDFQKKLWLKKKFVVETNYCITLDRIPKELYAEIAKNKEQWEEWQKLGFLTTKNTNDTKKGDDSLFNNSEDEIPGVPSVPWLKKNSFLVLDTKFFSSDFKARLLASIHNLDEQTDGLLIHSENFQALNFLQERYREQVKCIYIDPPYNTDASSILYKNNYKHSSWLSLIENRINAVLGVLKKNGICCLAIDDEEVSEVRRVLDSLFTKLVGIAVVRSNPQSRKTKGKFSPVHEYALFYGVSSETAPGSLEITEKRLARYPKEDKNGRFSWMNFIRTGNNDKREDRPKLYYPIFVSKNNTIRVPSMTWANTIGENGEYVLEESPGNNEVVVYPTADVDGVLIEKNWHRGPDRVSSEPDEFRIRRDESEKVSIDFKTRLDESSAPTTWWDNNEYASANYGASELKSLFGDKPFDFPKALSLVMDCLRAANTDLHATILDFFGGSGTTGNAVINLNREDNAKETGKGKRKYILVEMGGYFDTVLKPRIQKVVYAKDWKDGKPVARDTGISHCF
jgi:adenine-specific DNA-methyltransferase